jgi:hypothetical protein
LVIVNQKTTEVVCTKYSNGKKHDFKVLKESKVRLKKTTKALTDTGFLGLQKIHANTSMPKKKSKKHPLTKADKQQNKAISSERVLNEHVIGSIKRFKIVSDRYRNRRKRFGLRFNLIAAIHNFELKD